MFSSSRLRIRSICPTTPGSKHARSGTITGPPRPTLSRIPVFKRQFVSNLFHFSYLLCRYLSRISVSHFSLPQIHQPFGFEVTPKRLAVDSCKLYTLLNINQAFPRLIFCPCQQLPDPLTKRSRTCPSRLNQPHTPGHATQTYDNKAPRVRPLHEVLRTDEPHELNSPRLFFPPFPPSPLPRAPVHSPVCARILAT